MKDSRSIRSRFKKGDKLVVLAKNNPEFRQGTVLTFERFRYPYNWGDEFRDEIEISEKNRFIISTTDVRKIGPDELKIKLMMKFDKSVCT